MAKERTTLLLDSDIIAYKFAAAAQKTFDWDGDGSNVATTVDDLIEVIPKVKDYIDELIVQLEADDVVVCLSCPSDENFRYKVLPTYKHNRVGVAKPELLKAVKAWMAERYTSYERPGLEADDIMGILSTHPLLIKGKKIIVSEDKDMKTIPGWLFNPAKDTKPKRIDHDLAAYWHLYQTLVGDTTDGYKGCPGIGPKKAEALLHEFPTWDAVRWQYHCRGLTEEDALVQARVARICQFQDYNFDKKEVILWNPQ